MYGWLSSVTGLYRSARSVFIAGARPIAVTTPRASYITRHRTGVTHGNTNPGPCLPIATAVAASCLRITGTHLRPCLSITGTHLRPCLSVTDTHSGPCLSVTDTHSGPCLPVTDAHSGPCLPVTDVRLELEATPYRTGSRSAHTVAPTHGNVHPLHRGAAGACRLLDAASRGRAPTPPAGAASRHRRLGPRLTSPPHGRRSASLCSGC